MNVVVQIFAVAAVSLRSLPQRAGNSLVIVIGIAAVVAVLISVLAMSAGFGRTIQGGARADRVLILAGNADGEGSSSLSRESVATIQAAAGIKRNTAGNAIVSAEVVLVGAGCAQEHARTLTSRCAASDRKDTRSSGSEYRFRRMFETGLHEPTVGQAAETNPRTSTSGAYRLHDGDWTIVGVSPAATTCETRNASPTRKPCCPLTTSTRSIARPRCSPIRDRCEPCARRWTRPPST